VDKPPHHNAAAMTPSYGIQPARRAMVLTAAWTAAGIVIFIFAPMAAPVLLPLCAVAPLASYWVRHRRLPVYRFSKVTIALLLTGLYLLLNASWSLSPSSALAAVAQFFVIIAVLHVTTDALFAGTDEALRAMAWGVVVGVLVASAVVCLDVFTGQWPRRVVMSYIPAFKTDPRHLVVVQGWVTSALPHLLNRSISAISLLFWPALLIINRLPLAPRTRTMLSLALLPGVAAIFGSVHTTSKMAFLGAAAVYSVFSVSPWLAKRLTAGAWIAAMLLVVPLAAAAYSAQLYQGSWLPLSAQQRIVIWGYTSAQIAKAPLLGEGIGTARALVDFANPDLPRAPGTNFQLTTHVHSHNAYLQIWFEAGAVGAIFFLATGLLVLDVCSRASARWQPYVYASFSACALLAASSFSVWAPWFLASIAMAAICVILAVALPASAPCHQLRR
jgi:O-antigen ligase